MEPTEEQNRRQAERIGEVIQETGTIDWPAGTLLVGFALVADWVTSAGERHLSRIAPPDQPIWVTEGLLHEALKDEGWRD